MKEKPANPPRFQFTIANLLWAAFWAAAYFGCFGVMSLPTPFWIKIAAMAGVPFCPCVAVGCLFGRAFWGALAGIIAAIIYFVYLWSVAPFG